MKAVVKDSYQYGVDFLEATIVKHFKSYLLAHKLGKELAKENLDAQE